MSDDEHQIRAIIEYIESIGEPMNNWPKKEFYKISYTRWAANEILVTVLAHHDWTPIRSVEEFRYKVSKYAYKGTHYDDANEIFEIAYQTAVDISDILMAMMP